MLCCPFQRGSELQGRALANVHPWRCTELLHDVVEAPSALFTFMWFLWPPDLPGFCSLKPAGPLGLSLCCLYVNRHGSASPSLKTEVMAVKSLPCIRALT